MKLKKLTAWLYVMALMLMILIIAPQAVYALSNPFDDQNNKDVTYLPASGADGGFSSAQIDAAHTKPKILIDQKELEKSESAGKTITVTVSVKDTSNAFANAGLMFCYDTRLTLTKRDGKWLTPGSAISGFMTTTQVPSTGGCIFFVAASMGSSGHDGVLFEADFAVPYDADGGNIYPFGIQYVNESGYKSVFTNLDDDENGRLMQAWLFTRGISNGYIRIKGESPVQSGKTGSCNWSLNTTSGLLGISGSGYMADYENYDKAPWYYYHDKIKSITIGSGVNSIGDYAFVDTKITSLTIPVSVQSIGEGAVLRNTSLTEVKMGSGVKTIGKYGFALCASLMELKIPSSVTSIGDYAFGYGSGNNPHVIYSNTRTIVSECGVAGHIYAKVNGLNFISTKHLWETPTYTWAHDCSAVKAIRVCSFDDSHKETETVAATGAVTTPATNEAEGVMTYTSEAFSNAAFSKQTITVAIPKLDSTTPADPGSTTDPSSTTDPGSTTDPTPPSADSTVNEVTVSGGVYSLDFNNQTAIFVKPAMATARKLTIPATVTIDGKSLSVTSIAPNAFVGMKNLTSVVIGKNVKSIGKNAFKGCSKLKKITIKTIKLTKKSIGANAFKGIHKKAVFKCPKAKKATYKSILLKKGAKKTMTFK